MTSRNDLNYLVYVTIIYGPRIASVIGVYVLSVYCSVLLFVFIYIFRRWHWWRVHLWRHVQRYFFNRNLKLGSEGDVMALFQEYTTLIPQSNTA